jgi:hypothetical protein
MVAVNISNFFSIENSLKNMTSRISFLTILIFALLLTGCSKTPDVVETPEAKLVRLLTGVGNKYWHLNKIFINAVPQALTNAQLMFTKTYTINPSISDSGIFSNSDGITGKWTITGSKQFYEAFVTGGGVGIQLDYTVLDITETTMDIQYKSNNKLVEEVYYAY